MPHFAANLHYLFTEAAFLERFQAAARAGFKAVEFQVPYDYAPAELRTRLQTNGLQMVLFDAPMGDWSKGDRGLHGYFLHRTEQARRIIDEVASDNLFLHLDCYHMQLLEGHLAETIREHIGIVRHFQIAGVPGRHEPDVGEINYPFLFDLIDEMGYRGWIGCEYRPLGNTSDGLGWAARYGITASPPVGA
ncbi:MAG: hydroxypyruvate isomerase family protein [Burkholderiales bacterium]